MTMTRDPAMLDNTLALVGQGFYAGNMTNLRTTTQDPDTIRQWWEAGELAGVSTARFRDGGHLAVVVVRMAPELMEDGSVLESSEHEFREFKADGYFPRTLEVVNKTHRYLIYRSDKIVTQGRLGDGIWVWARGLIAPEFLATPEEIAEAPEWMLENASEPKAERKIVYKLQSVADLIAAPPPSWLIRDLLPAEGLCVLFGEPGSGKSFLVLDLLATIARGEAWAGQRTRKGATVYVGLEAQINARVAAYLRHNQLQPTDLADLHVIQRQAMSLTQPANAKQFIADLHTHGIEPAVVVIDTLARAMPGKDENSATDMSAAIACAGMISTAFDCLCILVHHSGKDASRGARGHSSLLGAADAELAVTYDKVTGVREVRATKMKDGADGVAWQFRLLPVDLGPGADDPAERVSSLVVDNVERVQGNGGRGRKPEMTPARQMVYQACVQALRDTGPGFDAPQECSRDEWARAYDELNPLRQDVEGVELTTARKTRARAFDRGVEWLVTQRLVLKEPGRPFYKLPSQAPA
ncbi:MAG TPA: AAA family ATPase [Frateuria sp.]|uniref:AAA family ATPase n=1 Tax=Frateuria sp. TaxID=2211372 RepID=UPI002DE2EB20|nr:AAA family ATPase [Frateuria sp.]